MNLLLLENINKINLKRLTYDVQSLVIILLPDMHTTIWQISFYGKWSVKMMEACFYLKEVDTDGSTFDDKTTISKTFCNYVFILKRVIYNQ